MGAFKILEFAKETRSVRTTLERFERSKILEVYFARMDGRIRQHIPDDIKPLYDVDLVHIRAYLLGDLPQDNLFSKFFSRL